MEFNIDFWLDETEKAFYKLRDVLTENSNMDEIQATHFLENIYYIVSKEYGD